MNNVVIKNGVYFDKACRFDINYFQTHYKMKYAVIADVYYSKLKSRSFSFVYLNLSWQSVRLQGTTVKCHYKFRHDFVIN